MLRRMTDYRLVTRKVGYWRGNPHRWSNSYEFTGSGTTPNVAALNTFVTNESKLLYSQTGVLSGGICEAAIYLASGGVPVAQVINFDYTIPSAWPGYSSTGWASKALVLNDPMEAALAIEWPAGLSVTGKPVFFRKYYHAVPQSNGGGTGAQDVSSGNLASLATAAEALVTCLAPTYGLVLGNSRRLAGTSPAVNPYYLNHQMPKGRRKTSVTGGGSTSKIKYVPSLTPPVDEDEGE